MTTEKEKDNLDCGMDFTRELTKEEIKEIYNNGKSLFEEELKNDF
jgi:hypothetical protein